MSPYIIGSLGVRFVSAIALALATDEARKPGSAVCAYFRDIPIRIFRLHLGVHPLANVLA